MWLVLGSLRRPITVLVAVVGLIVGASLAVARMPRDIFPDLEMPVVYVTQTWPGMTPAQVEGLIVSKYEDHFLYIAGLEHIESRSVQGVTMLKLFFHPGTDTSYAVAQVTAMAYRAAAFMPPGTLPPFIMRLDQGSFPAAQLVFESKSIATRWCPPSFPTLCGAARRWRRNSRALNDPGYKLIKGGCEGMSEIIFTAITSRSNIRDPRRAIH